MSKISSMPDGIPAQTHISHIHSYMNIQTKCYLLILKKTNIQHKHRIDGAANEACTQESVSMIPNFALISDFLKNVFLVSLSFPEKSLLK